MKKKKESRVEVARAVERPEQRRVLPAPLLLLKPTSPPLTSILRYSVTLAFDIILRAARLRRGRAPPAAGVKGIS